MKTLNKFQKNFAFLIVLLSIPISQLFIDVYIPAFPLIADDLNVKNLYIQNSLSIYILSLGIFQLIYGTLSDFYGRKKLLIIGYILGIIGTFLASTAHSIEFFIFARFLQGLGFAAFGSICGAIILDISENNKEISIKNSYLSMAYSVTPIIAPYIGSILLLLYNDEWQAIFYSLGFFLIIILLFIIFKLEETKSDEKNIETNNDEKNSKIKITLKKYKELLKSPLFISLSLFLGLIWSGSLCFLSIAPFVLLKDYNIDSYHFGLFALCLGFFGLLGTTLNRILITRFKPTQILNYSLSISLIVSIIFVVLVFLGFKSFNLIFIITSILFLSYGFGYINGYNLLILSFQKNAGTVISLIATIVCFTPTIYIFTVSFLNESIINLALIMLSIHFLLMSSYLFSRTF